MRTVKTKIKLKTKKIPTPQTFCLCPLCEEPLKQQYIEERQEVVYYCLNGECEVDYLATKKTTGW